MGSGVALIAIGSAVVIAIGSVGSGVALASAAGCAALAGDCGAGASGTDGLHAIGASRSNAPKISAAKAFVSLQLSIAPLLWGRYGMSGEGCSSRIGCLRGTAVG